MAKVKGDKMTILGVGISIPEAEKKRLVQAEVNQELFDQASREMKKRKVKIRQIVEWGLLNYLADKNPSAAKKFGINKP